MALENSYATPNELRAYLKTQLENSDQELEDILQSASREIDSHCERQFNKAGYATARTFEPCDPLEIEVDDFCSTTGLVIELDTGYTGTYETTLSAGNYTLYPLNGVVDGQSGWPYNTIKVVHAGMWLPVLRSPGYPTNTVRVTAQWGWDAVPAPVKRSCLLLAAQMREMQSAPFGVAGMGQFGVVRVRDIPQVYTKLCPYVRNPIKAA